MYDFTYLIARDVYDGMPENFRLLVKKNNRHLPLFNAIANAAEPCLAMQRSRWAFNFQMLLKYEDIKRCHHCSCPLRDLKALERH